MIVGGDGDGNSINKREALLTKGDFKIFQPDACFAWRSAENAGLVIPKDNSAGNEPGLAEE